MKTLRELSIGLLIVDAVFAFLFGVALIIGGAATINIPLWQRVFFGLGGITIGSIPLIYIALVVSRK